MSNEVLRAIADRRSIRQYKPEQITQEQLDILLNAAVQSPSARNSQPWHFTVVRDQSIVREINEKACAALAKGGGVYANVRNIFYDAPTVIFISANKEATPWASLDCGIAAQTISLAAHSIGLGSVPLGLPGMAWGEDKAENARLNALLKFPEGYSFALAIAVGYPAGTKEAHPVSEGHIDIIG
ncbi:MAG: nitroreductase [Oscillospiraceae bacterium]|jgi:nitroreductase|nr:nitroreductase [Oscillospiraceae bacterium]